MPSGVYNFEPDSHESVKASRYDDLPPLSSRGELISAQKALLELISGPQEDKFANRGYVAVVNGSWGAGKTTATWAMLNEIREVVRGVESREEPIVIDRSFLPFGNVGESITSFLQELGHKLWVNGLVDVRKNMEQFILEVTPASDLTASLSLGPMSLTRSVKLTSEDVTHAVMVGEFRKLASKGKSVVLVIDDVDRLRPDEIVQVMRLVERLRALPRVLIVLPVYKQIITDAFQNELRLSAAAAPTFLRKLTDIEIRMENNLSDISSAFTELISVNVEQEFASAMRGYNLTIEQLCWFMLMHNMILAEAVAMAPGMDSPARLFDGITSPYLHSLQQLFFAHNRITSTPFKNAVAPYPAHYRDDQNQEVFAPLGRHYGDIANNPGNEASIRQLSDNRSLPNVMKLVTKDPTLDSALWNAGQVDFRHELEQGSSAPVVIEVFIPLLRNLSDEPLITDNYKLRDVRNLARKIMGHPYFKSDGNSTVEDIYYAVKDSFDAFRF